jgi:hypothetical protein
MPSGFVTRSLARGAGHVPGIRRVPVLKLLSIAEVAMVARNHLERLTPAERRRLVVLMRAGRGRPSNLRRAEREELRELVAKLEPRLLAGEAVDRLSPVPLPNRLVYGRHRPDRRVRR